jgi:hypothetical protein
MAKVLQANGITPTPLLIKYLEVDCAHCDSYSTDENDNPTCDVYWPEDEDCCWQEALEKISFWTFVTDSNDLKGIASDFKDFHREVTEILDADGRVLWKANEEKVEQ